MKNIYFCLCFDKAELVEFTSEASKAKHTSYAWPFGWGCNALNSSPSVCSARVVSLNPRPFRGVGCRAACPGLPLRGAGPSLLPSSCKRPTSRLYMRPSSPAVYFGIHGGYFYLAEAKVCRPPGDQIRLCDRGGGIVHIVAAALGTPRH